MMALNQGLSVRVSNILMRSLGSDRPYCNEGARGHEGRRVLGSWTSPVENQNEKGFQYSRREDDVSGKNLNRNEALPKKHQQSTTSL